MCNMCDYVFQIITFMIEYSFPMYKGAIHFKIDHLYS